jgi:UrcA family protein
VALTRCHFRTHFLRYQDVPRAGHINAVDNANSAPSLIRRETIMNTNTAILNTRFFICIAALSACVVLSGPVKADNRDVVTVKIPVKAEGLDLKQPADAREVYRRLHFAARTACGNGNRVGLKPPSSFAACYEKALGDAVRSVNRPQLNIIYLATHTSRDAEIFGIELPARMAAK